MDIKPRNREFQTQFPRLFSIAYRMLGTQTDAEDVLQDTWLKWQHVDLLKLESPAAYLTTMVTRLCIDRKRRAKVEQLLYQGPWLPEPLDDECMSLIHEPEAASEQAEMVSVGFMKLLEQLSPMERAVFILREAFDLAHDQIAAMLDIRTSYSRQLLRRAKRRIDENEPTTEPTEEFTDLIAAFMTAASTGDLNGLQQLMCDDIVAYSDGGGRASAAIIPLVGKERVATVFGHILSKKSAGLTMEYCNVNGRPGLLMKDSAGTHSIHTVEIRDGKIHRAYSYRNPEKLKRFNKS